MSVTPSDVLPSCFSIWRAHTFGENPRIWRGCKCGLSREPWIVSFGPAAHEEWVTLFAYRPYLQAPLPIG